MRHEKSLTTLLAIASLMAVSMPAVAAKGGNPSKPPLGGTTCAEYSDAAFESDGDINGLPLAGRIDEACVDVSDVNPGPWDVTVTVTEGTLRSLQVVLRDSVAPGDACSEPIHYRDNTAAPATLTFTLEGAAGDHVRRVAKSGPSGWMVPTTTAPSRARLALLVYIQGSRSLAMTLNADLP